MTPAARSPRRDRPGRAVTEEQRHAARIIACLTLLNGRPPLGPEIARVLGVSKVAVHKRLHYMAKKGLWSRDERRLTELGLRAGLGAEPGPEPIG